MICMNDKECRTWNLMECLTKLDMECRKNLDEW